MKKTVIVIPARLDSSRLPRKALKKINDNCTLIQQVYLNALESKIADHVVVATDSNEIKQSIVNVGGEVFFSSTKHSNGTSRVAEILKIYDYDYIVNLQGDEPLVFFDVIDTVIREIKKDKYGVVTAYYMTNDKKVIDDYNSVKLVTDKEEKVLYFSRSNIPFGVEEKNRVRKVHIGIYAFTKETLLEYVKFNECNIEIDESLEQLRFLYNGIAIKAVCVNTKHEMVSINSTDDLIKLKKIYTEKNMLKIN